MKKNVPWHILAPRAVACDNLHLRASAHLWHVSAFLCNWEFLGISCYIKNGCRVVSPAATDLIIIDSHNSTPMQEAAYEPDKTHNSYTGRFSYGSPAVHDTARSEAMKAMQVPAGRVQSPSQKTGWGTSDLPEALR